MYDLLFYFSICLLNNNDYKLYFYSLLNYHNINNNNKLKLKNYIKKYTNDDIIYFFKDIHNYITFYSNKLDIDLLFFIKQNVINNNKLIKSLLNNNTIDYIHKIKIAVCYILYYYKFNKILIPFNKNIINKSNYFELFHKEILNDNNYLKNVTLYKTIFKCYLYGGCKNLIKKFKSLIYLHFHIYDIKKLFLYINKELLDKLIKYKIKVIITFCNKIIDFKCLFINNNDNEIIKIIKYLYKKNKIIFLNILNHGMDIGPKILATEFLNKNNINYSYIIYMHSKSNLKLYNFYKNCIIDNLNVLIKTINNNKLKIKYNFFPCSVMYGYNNLLYTKNFYIKDFFTKLKKKGNFPNYKNNYLLMKQFLKYFHNINIHNKKYSNLFIDGNFYILNKHSIHKIFNYDNFYSLLNNRLSFEYTWFNSNYNLNTNIFESFYIYKTNKKYHGNLLFINNEKGIRDYMFEHIFERITLYIIKNIKNSKVILYLPNKFKINNLLKSLKVNIENYINNE